MGYWKERQIEEGEQGWRFVDDAFVCADCWDDYALKAVVSAALVANECTYCGRSAQHPIAAELDDVLAVIGRGLFAEWSLAENELFYDEGEYVGPTWDTADLFEVLGWPTENEKLQDALRLAFADNLWCERNPFALRPEEALAAGWSEFKEMVVTKSRYLFLITEDDRDHRGHGEIAPAQMLRALAQAIETAELAIVLAAGERVWRARVHRVDEQPVSASELGTPKVARYSNRMSPAGIPIFYGALERQTAIAEVADRRNPTRPVGTIAGFILARDVKVLDLAHLPEIPSLFDDDRRQQRAAIMFLHGFADDIANPVDPDEFEHVEYVPTQIVTEFVRNHLARSGGPYDGVLYRSSKNQEGSNLGLFFDHSQCHDEDPSEVDGLILDPDSIESFSAAE